MLDPLPIGEPEPKQALRCEVCGLYYDNEEDWECIDNDGMCWDCMMHEAKKH